MTYIPRTALQAGLAQFMLNEHIAAAELAAQQKLLNKQIKHKHDYQVCKQRDAAKKLAKQAQQQLTT